MAATKEPCAGCGEETCVGSALYSDRRSVTGADGRPQFVCSICAAKAAASRRGQRLTDDEISQLVKNGSMAMIAATGGMH